MRRRISQVDEFIKQLMLHQHDKDEVSKVSERMGKRIRNGHGPVQGNGSSQTGV